MSDEHTPVPGSDVPDSSVPHSDTPEGWVGQVDPSQLEELKVPDEFQSEETEAESYSDEESDESAEKTEDGRTVGGSLEEVAREAAAGNWGTGVDKRRALEEAGYDPNEVEAKIVELRNPNVQ